MKLKYVQRQGRYHYFRFPGAERIRLRGEPGSKEYLDHYAELLALAEQPKPDPKIVAFPSTIEKPIARPVGPVQFLPGSLGWVMDKFLASRIHWADKYPKGTQGRYRRVFDILRSMRINEELLATGPIADLRRSHVRQICLIVADEHGTSPADVAKRLLSTLWQFSLALPQAKTSEIDDDRGNPCEGLATMHRIKRPHKAWPEHVQRAFLDGADDRERLAFHLARYTGFRRSDVGKIRWTDYDAKRRTICIRTTKTGESVPMHVADELREVLDRLPRTSEFILTGGRGKAYAFGESISRVIKLRLRKLGFAGYTLHGLRTTFAVALADNGAEAVGMMHALGHRDLKQSLHYIREARKAPLIKAAVSARKRQAG